jgi:predicted HD superfamily hydrolase involved in NAD metabolism
MSMDIIEIQRHLKKKQSEHRFTHSLGVQYTSICLAMKYGYDLSKAELAGILHDCAKHYSAEKLIKICEKNKIPITDSESKSPFLLHAKVGALLAVDKYGVTDNTVLDAIRCHTTGKPAMTMLEKIVFVADYIEPGRNNAPNLDTLRQLSFENIDEAVLAILQQTLDYLKGKKQDIDQHTVETYNYYKHLLGREDDE